MKPAAIVPASSTVRLFPRSGAFPAVALPPIAHQGGWDEILLVALPLAAIGGLLWIANRRVDAKLRAEESADATDRS